MMNELWTDLGPTTDFPNNAHACIDVDGIPLVVLNVDGELYALLNRCPHAGAPMGDGERHGMTLTCPYHGYTYHIKTGRNIDFPDDERPAKTYPIRVEAGIVKILIDNDEA